MPGSEWIDAPWWPFAFMVLAGALPTHIWRWMGVAFGTRLDEDSEALRWVRAVATALVAAVVARLVLFPQGHLAELPTWMRLFAFLAGFAAYFAGGRRPIVGILFGQFVLAIELWWTFG
ncbi:Branched-chain amino acid transport protein (AzlD) [Hartmannibacter diazotrophicus]|uniref:Branched-chain amino acid transport protein (AzlD) n=1 Tax=Hartmannibacter diazotrophicus TaxID=1482074 RepID=A0A2C9D764_9HYPH|nr:AzlD domain-containing protein [Hartmannibacter diazotrophicus]SON56019.1 Branched-chain amino acid transport protein (AzlD) [Hartmannibacter diazotrophicus]